jgi:flavodoxin I
MKTLIVYDSTYGNTEKLAKAIGAALGAQASVLRVTQAATEALGGLELLIVASPTMGGRPTEAILSFLGGIPTGALQNVKAAAVDTRLKAKWVKIFGYAADKIAARLVKAGGVPVAAPEGFFVAGSKGPLVDRELERAEAWARKIAASR